MRGPGAHCRECSPPLTVTASARVAAVALCCGISARFVWRWDPGRFLVGAAATAGFGVPIVSAFVSNGEKRVGVRGVNGLWSHWMAVGC